MVKNRKQIKCLFKLKTSKGTFTQMSFFYELLLEATKNLYFLWQSHQSQISGCFK